MKYVPWLLGLLLAGLAMITWRQAMAHDAKARALEGRYAADREAWADTLVFMESRLTQLREDSARTYAAMAVIRQRLTGAQRTADLATTRLQKALRAGISTPEGQDSALADVEALVAAQGACRAAVDHMEQVLHQCESRVSAERERAMMALAQLTKRDSVIAAYQDLANPNLLRTLWSARAVTLPLVGLVAALLLLR